MSTHVTLNRLRLLACVLLIVSLFLPLYTMPVSWSGAVQSNYLWDVGRGDPAGSVILALAYVLPVTLIVLHRRRLSYLGTIVLVLAEPVLLGISAAVLLTVVNSAFALLPLFGPWLVIPVSVTIGPGAWLALLADGMLASLWLVVVGRHARQAAAGTVTA